MHQYNSNGTFDLLIIDDLGDGLDGYEGKTTRGGHELEQNMSSVEAFETFVLAKLSLIERCIDEGVANKYLIRNVCNDNHAGSFASISNMAIKMILDRIYEDSVVDFYILEKFMSHFDYGDHAFIITHGKDNKYMFKGLPYQLNDKTISFINEYIDHFGIKNKFKCCTFEICQNSQMIFTHISKAYETDFYVSVHIISYFGMFDGKSRSSNEGW